MMANIEFSTASTERTERWFLSVVEGPQAVNSAQQPCHSTQVRTCKTLWREPSDPRGFLVIVCTAVSGRRKPLQEGSPDLQKDRGHKLRCDSGKLLAMSDSETSWAKSLLNTQESHVYKATSPYITRRDGMARQLLLLKKSLSSATWRASLCLFSPYSR